ncbi:MAG TPA: hypothetical protein VHJ78_04420, partial [Actinomycetota bacterium]|nr:hypothetical protein [Actinomycetota bacterium]
YPSPILPDGRLISFPIPGHQGVPYADLRLDGGPTYADLMSQLGITNVRAGRRGRIPTDQARAHVDPDIAPTVLERMPGWFPAFGQLGAAQGHLRNNGVAPGDLFLFFGWFAEVGHTATNLRFRRDAPPVQSLWGYLEVGEVMPVASTVEPPPWLAVHPHFAYRERPGYAHRSNTVYIAAPRLSLAPHLPGAGTLGRFRPAIRLSKLGGPPSLWDLPAAFHPSRTGTPLTFHGSAARWSLEGKRTVLDAAKQGQEFVVRCTPELQDWTAELLSASA